ncbi:transposase [Streptomyces sp. NPDC087532]|uniref:transposase n=1 Tax=Streptomyces sp. NPDC087532 TaxID=3365795 RepID=UPI0038177B59
MNTVPGGPLSWRLFVPPEWDDRDDVHRERTGLPPEVGHVEKWRLAIDMLDVTLAWGLLAGRCR